MAVQLFWEQRCASVHETSCPRRCLLPAIVACRQNGGRKIRFPRSRYLSLAGFPGYPSEGLTRIKTKYYGRLEKLPRAFFNKKSHVMANQKLRLKAEALEVPNHFFERAPFCFKKFFFHHDGDVFFLRGLWDR
jgi:hypothetical protein